MKKRRSATFLFLHSSFFILPLLVFSGRNSKVSPGWQSSVSQIASSVEKRMALALPVLRMDRFCGVNSTASDRSFSRILRCARTTSRLTMMDIIKVGADIQPPTSNIEHPMLRASLSLDVDCWLFDVECFHSVKRSIPVPLAGPAPRGKATQKISKSTPQTTIPSQAINVSNQNCLRRGFG